MEDRPDIHKNIRGIAVPILLIAGLAIAWLLATAGENQQTLAAAVIPASDASHSKIIFNRDIRPILADRCFSCHGPDPNKRQAGLRLDRPEAALGPCPQHPKLRAFVPGDPDHSEALRRILTTDPVAIMPPVSSHHTLDAKEKELIRQWLIQGGAYQEHWAFTKPERPPLPEVKNKAWAKNDIDKFVLANLESQGLSPSHQADKATLIRRVSVDITGIPPTPAEVDAFVADSAPNAYEKLVDRLLASPQYGEQMATQWLDYARYADSHGYQSDPERHMWRWRDWVIQAYNSNMPFDEFAIEQLAGDLLPNATLDQKIATGFNRNHRMNDEGGIIAEEWRVEGVIDRVSTTSAVFMGLTMECCRCHDHKYDPITQKEFYSFSAYFNSVNEVGIGDTGPTDKGVNLAPMLKVGTPEQMKQMDAMSAHIADMTARVDDLKKTIPDRIAKLSPTDLDPPPGLLASFTLNGDLQGDDAENQPIETSYAGKTGPNFITNDSGKSLQFTGESGNSVNAGEAVSFDRTDHFSYGGWVKRHTGGAFVSKMNTRDAFRGFDLYCEGDRVSVHIIHHWDNQALKVKTRTVLPANVWKHVFATYDGSGKASGVKIYVDGISQPLMVLNDALVDTIKTTSPVLIGTRDGADAFDGDVSDIRFYNHTLSAAEVGLLAKGERARNILNVPTAKRTPSQQKELAMFVEATDPDISAAVNDLNEAKKQKSSLEAMLPDTMVMEDLPKPRDTFLLMRGEYDKHGDKVQPGVPAVLPPLPKDAPPNRLGLARWIVDPGNPLTARVQVNRLWEKFFGVGLVKTSENMGTQTEWPSNPELLDWLATEFVSLHWDMKALQKEMVMSAAYQQASEVTPEMVETDPENRLLERGPRFRMSAEEIRDQALAASGLLVEKVGGPSVKPYEPGNLWAGNLFGNLATYTVDAGDALYRRSIYTFIKRTAVPANLSLFDQPSREYCLIRRSRTDTPLQALDLMNDPTYLEAARVLAEHTMTEGGNDAAARIAFAFKRVTCRTPTDAELKILLAGFQNHLDHFQKEPDAAAKLVKVGASPIDPKLNVQELAAYTMTSSVILNLDETVTRQ